MTTRQRGGLLRRKKQSAEDKAFTPEKVQQRVKEYEEVKNRPAKQASKPATKPTEKYDENEGIGFDQAFAKAKKAGDGTFKWKGKMYNTNSAAEKKQGGGKMPWAERKLQKSLAKATEIPKYKTIGPNVSGNDLISKAPIKPSKMPNGRKIKVESLPKKLGTAPKLK